MLYEHLSNRSSMSIFLYGGASSRPVQFVLYSYLPGLLSNPVPDNHYYRLPSFSSVHLFHPNISILFSFAPSAFFLSIIWLCCFSFHLACVELFSFSWCQLISSSCTGAFQVHAILLPLQIHALFKRSYYFCTTHYVIFGIFLHFFTDTLRFHSSNHTDSFGIWFHYYS